VSPRQKIAEWRRQEAHNHLRMIGHSALLYRTEQGRPAASLEALAMADCCPGKFNEKPLAGPRGSRYSLSPDGTGICRSYGTAVFLTPCCELEVANVIGTEADAYNTFKEAFDAQSRSWCVPMALRVQVTDKRCRLETVLTPLGDDG